MEHKGNKRRGRRTAEQGSVGFNDVAKNSFLGVLSALITMAALSVASAAVCMLTNDPAAFTLPVGIAVFLVSSAVGGFVSARRLSRDKTAAVISGVICGFALMLFTGIGAVLQNLLASEATHGLHIAVAVLIRALAIPMSALGACIDKNKRAVRRRTRR